MTAWYTKSLTDTDPSGLVHHTEDGQVTTCGKSYWGKRWYNGKDTVKVTCPYCLKIMEKENAGKGKSKP